MALSAAASLALLLAGCGIHEEGEASSDYQCDDCNVVLISIDTLRADRLGVYGHYRDTSPYLDSLAAEGVVFERFIHNGGGTLPSHLSMLTSLRPGAHGVTIHNGRRLPAARATLAEVLRAAGFATAAFTDGGWMLDKFGFSQGFDLFDEQGGRLATIRPKVDAWLDRNRDRRLFLFVHSYDVHSEWEGLPYDCPGGYARRFVSDDRAFDDIAFDGCRDGKCASTLLGWVNSRIQNGELTAAEAFSEEEVEFIGALYDGCVSYADSQIAALGEKLRELGIYDRTLIVVTSDHGEEFGEHGLFLHANAAYEEMVHIPLILKLPRSWGGGRRVPHLAAMVDLAPTVLDILGVAPHPQMQGTSLMRSVTADLQLREQVGIEDTLLSGGWKYFSETGLLIDFVNDPRELEDLSQLRPEIKARLEEQLLKLMSEDEMLLEAFERSQLSREEEVTLTEKESAELKSLGYLN